MDDIYQYIGQRIRLYRNERNLSQEGLAQAIGVSPNTVSRWETAAYKPAVDDLQRLGQFFNMPIAAFLPEEGEQYERGRHNALEAMQRYIDAVK